MKSNPVDLTEKYGLILGDGYTLSPPEPKIYTVDLPGTDGSIDLTETLFGATAYENRSQQFTFYSLPGNNFERLKTTISNLLHGKSFYYTLTMDPDYIYRGRFKIETYSHETFAEGNLGTIEISVSADPYKLKTPSYYSISAIGGTVVGLESGARRVRPTFQATAPFRIIFKNKIYDLPAGSYQIRDVVFEPGINEIYLNSYRRSLMTYSELKNYKWGVPASADRPAFNSKRLYEWYSLPNDNLYTQLTWGELNEQGTKWKDFTEAYPQVRWDNIVKKIDPEDVPSDVSDIIITYEWGDL